MIGTECDFGRGFWARDRLATGKEIDNLRGQNIPSNSRTIDRTTVPTSIVSHKSTDIRRKSYRRLSKVYRTGMRFATELSQYEGEIRKDHRKKATYHLHWALEMSECKRVLEWFIPLTGVADDQMQAVERVVRDAAALGVEVNVYRVLD